MTTAFFPEQLRSAGTAASELASRAGQSLQKLREKAAIGARSAVVMDIVLAATVKGLRRTHEHRVGIVGTLAAALGATAVALSVLGAKKLNAESIFPALADSVTGSTKPNAATGTLDTLATGGWVAAGSVATAGATLFLKHDKEERQPYVDATATAEYVRPGQAARPLRLSQWPATNLWLFAEQSADRADELNAHLDAIDPDGDPEQRLLGGLITAKFGSELPKSTTVYYADSFQPGYDADVIHDRYYSDTQRDAAEIKEMLPQELPDVPSSSSTFQRGLHDILVPAR